MEKLQRRSDGFYETPSGLFAISPRVASGHNKEDGTSWFEFRATVLSEVTRIVWPTVASVIATDQQVALTMMRNRYADNITDTQMDEYNAAIDAYNARLKNPSAQTPPPAPETPPAPPAPPVPESDPDVKKGKKTAE